MLNKKTPNPIDRHVGTRLRARRLTVGMSQEKLGEALGLTFQQVQKYEKGTNRIGASRLQAISGVLEVPVAFFFENAPGAKASTAPVVDYANELCATTGGLALARAFPRIKDAGTRRALVALAEAAAAAA